MKSPLNPATPRKALPLPKSLQEFPVKKPSNQEVSWDDLEQRPLVIGITSAKGGTGKSSTALNLAAYLTEPQGPENTIIDRKILVINADANSFAPMRIPDKGPNIETLLDNIEAGAINSFEDVTDHMMTRTDLANLHVLMPAEDDTYFAQADLEKVLKKVSVYYTAIVVDMGSELNTNSFKFWESKYDSLFWTSAPEKICLKANETYAARIGRSSNHHRQQIVILDEGYKAQHLVQATLPYWPKNQVHYLGYYDKEIAKSNNKSQFFALTRAGAKYKAKLSELQQAAFHLGYR
jgi:MinD-like ATPase involved in chromosome partitioning or flagellar assembly